MSRSTANILISPLFYDVLSGEFEPPSDPKQRVHSLGRLAFSACKMGNMVISGSRVGEHVDFTYRPSWAQQVKAQVSTKYFFGPSMYIINQLLITADNGDELDVSHFTANGHEFVDINYLQTRESLELGSSLDTKKSELTQLAQELFNKVNE